MHVLHVATECAPWAKSGGLADVVGALPRWLPRARSGWTASVLIPRYAHLNLAAEPVVTGAVRVGDEHLEHVTLLAKSVQEFPLFLVDHPVFHGQGLYPPMGQLERQAVLGHAAAELVAASHASAVLPPVDVVHLHDHHVSLAAVWLRHGTFGPSPPLVLTVHNARYGGPLDWLGLEKLDLPETLDRGACDHDASWSSLKAGVLHADVVSTVSPTHASGLLHQPHASHGLHYAFKMLGDRFTGILNGIDTDAWNPATDPALDAPYSADDPAGKQVTKAAVCREHRLDPQRPLVVFIGRLVPEKGLDQIVEALPQLARQAPDAQVIVLGSGESRYHDALAGLERGLGGRVRLALRHDETLAHRLYAAADILLMPSWFEPCGLSQMYAMRYGAIPVVFPTGGLRDSVVPFDPSTGRGQGVWMGAHDGESLTLAVLAALGWWRDTGVRARLVHEGMTSDVSWRRSAGLHAETYQRARALRS